MGLFDKLKKKKEKEADTPIPDAAADVSEKYLNLRKQLLDCKPENIGVNLTKDDQVYVVAFDMPNETLVAGNHTVTLGLVFDCNVHMYFGNGSAWVDMENDGNVFQTMMSVCISAGQVLNKMKKTDHYDYYESSNVRAYLKTRKGVFYKELNPGVREDSFLLMMKDKMLEAVNAMPKEKIRQVG